jgi:hypothetical protein
MKYQLELNTELTLLDNLNVIEDSLRLNGLMSTTDTLIAITDNPLDPSSITIADGITISALDNPNSAEVLSVMPHDGSSITLSDMTPTINTESSETESGLKLHSDAVAQSEQNDSNPDYSDTKAISDVFDSLLDDD